MEVSPNLIVDINTELEHLITSNWQRVMKRGGDWGRLMKRRPGQGKREILTWLLDTSGLYPQDNGGQIRFDDMAAATTEIDVTDVGAGLILTSNELADNQWKGNPKIGAMDYAQKWARDRGAEAAYFPRRNLFQMILANGGAGPTTYDGLPFFSTAHPVNPSRPNGPTYQNVWTGTQYDISQATGSVNDLAAASQGLGAALGAIAGLTFDSFGTPRFLVPSILVCATQQGLRMRQLIGMSGGDGAEILSQTSNVFSDYGFDAPIEAPELNGSPTTYYVGCEDLISDELGAFIMSERDAFELLGYPDTDSAAANRARQWEWHFHGRYGFLPGHPYLFHKFVP